jgi:2-furoyl-CoA dehydrogenase FAD binding subunit
VKPPPFDYRRAESVEEAVALLVEGGEDAKILAGGQSLVPLMNMRLLRPSLLVDVNRIPGLEDVVHENGRTRVGATVRQSDPRLRELPLLAECLPHVGHTATRNRGTVCGSIAHGDAAAELPLALTLLGGSVVAASARGRREISAGDFFQTHFTTALAPDEVVVETVWPREQGCAYAFEELAPRHGDYALCMAAVAIDADRLRVGLGAVVDRPTLVEVDPEQPGRSAAARVEPWGNMHASAEYQRHLVRVLVDRAVERARGSAA